jgi:hypothetical protein
MAGMQYDAAHAGVCVVPDATTVLERFDGRIKGCAD